MRFWDSSAIVPLLVEQACTDEMMKCIKSDTIQIVAWTTHGECFSALARLERDGLLSLEQFETAHNRLLSYSSSWQIVVPCQELLDEQKRLLRVHPLRAADSIQLGSAILASAKNPKMLEFVSLDVKLSHAASKEGFRLGCQKLASI